LTTYCLPSIKRVKAPVKKETVVRHHEESKLVRKEEDEGEDNALRDEQARDRVT